MLQNVLNFLKKHSEITSTEYIVAVSGGVDSIVLLDLLIKLNVKVSIAHCDFSLRKTTYEEKELVEGIANKNDIKVYFKKFDTKRYASSKKISIQLAARELRYNWFGKLLETEKNSKILTAHHLNDNVETVLYNLIKGTGVRGLTGINPSDSKYLRPLLNFKKEDIYKYAFKNNLEFIEDKSNLENKYNRNKIRNKIVPVAQTINSNFLNTMKETINYFGFIDDLLKEKVQKVKESLVQIEDNQIKISIKDVKKLSKYLFYELIKEYGFNSKASESIWFRLKDYRTGSEFLSNSHKLVLDRDQIVIIEKKKENYLEISIKESDLDSHLTLSVDSLQLKFTLLNNSLQIPKDKNQAWIDYSKLKFPLKVRRWKNGDYFFPIGLGHKQKVKKYFVNNKFSLIDKENTYLLTDSEENIIWIMGHRLDNRFIVTKETLNVLKIVIV